MSPLATLPALPANSFREQLLFHTGELDEARERVTRLYTRHRLDFIGRQRQLDTYFYHIPLLRASVNCLGYGSDMVVEPGELQNFFLVQTPIRGGGLTVCGAQSIHSDSNLSSVLSPSEYARMNWCADCWQVQVRLDRAFIEQSLAALLERPLGEPIVFQLGMDMRSDSGVSWWNTVRYVAEEAHRLGFLPNSAMMARQLEQLLANSLLHLQPHNYSEQLLNRQPNIAPRHVRRAEEYMAAHCHRDVGIEELAEVSGVSVRTLYRGFQQFRGLSPMQHLKSVRLDEAHRLLKAAAPSDSVTRIALDLGFRQLGRFAVEYRKRFGESPSDTLRH